MQPNPQETPDGRVLDGRVMVNVLLRKISRENLNDAILFVKIASFRFPQKIFLKKKLYSRATLTCGSLNVNYFNEVTELRTEIT